MASHKDSSRPGLRQLVNLLTCFLPFQPGALDAGIKPGECAGAKLIAAVVDRDRKFHASERTRNQIALLHQKRFSATRLYDACSMAENPQVRRPVPTKNASLAAELSASPRSEGELPPFLLVRHRRFQGCHIDRSFAGRLVVARLGNSSQTPTKPHSDTAFCVQGSVPCAAIEEICPSSPDTGWKMSLPCSRLSSSPTRRALFSAWSTSAWVCADSSIFAFFFVPLPGRHRVVTTLGMFLSGSYFSRIGVSHRTFPDTSFNCRFTESGCGGLLIAVANASSWPASLGSIVSL